MEEDNYQQQELFETEILNDIFENEKLNSGDNIPIYVFHIYIYIYIY